MPAVRFARVMKRIYGISPMQMITKARITVGCRLLRETDTSIAQIALASAGGSQQLPRPRGKLRPLVPEGHHLSIL